MKWTRKKIENGLKASFWNLFKPSTHTLELASADCTTVMQKTRKIRVFREQCIQCDFPEASKTKKDGAQVLTTNWTPEVRNLSKRRKNKAKRSTTSLLKRHGDSHQMQKSVNIKSPDVTEDCKPIPEKRKIRCKSLAPSNKWLVKERESVFNKDTVAAVPRMANRFGTNSSICNSTIALINQDEHCVEVVRLTPVDTDHSPALIAVPSHNTRHLNDSTLANTSLISKTQKPSQVQIQAGDSHKSHLNGAESRATSAVGLQKTNLDKNSIGNIPECSCGIQKYPDIYGPGIQTSECSKTKCTSLERQPDCKHRGLYRTSKALYESVYGSMPITFQEPSANSVSVDLSSSLPCVELEVAVGKNRLQSNKLGLPTTDYSSSEETLQTRSVKKQTKEFGDAYFPPVCKRIIGAPITVHARQPYPRCLSFKGTDCWTATLHKRTNHRPNSAMPDIGHSSMFTFRNQTRSQPPTRQSNMAIVHDSTGTSLNQNIHPVARKRMMNCSRSTRCKSNERVAIRSSVHQTRPVRSRGKSVHSCASLTNTTTPSETNSKASRTNVNNRGWKYTRTGSTSDEGDFVQRNGKSTENTFTACNKQSTNSMHMPETMQNSGSNEDCDTPKLLFEEKKLTTKQIGGALPAVADPDVCPTGRHPDLRPDKPCICIMVKKMVLAQSKHVLYSWHAKVYKTPMAFMSNQRATNVGYQLTATASMVGETSTKVWTPNLRTNPPTLPNFQLARPTRMVRGGQGTVAWVTNLSTGQFYALKFKQRTGRSDSTWEIERREAKLLRCVKHDFIVRLFHIYETEETLFMALEWLDGGCLWNHIARIGSMPECYAVYYTACILTALQYMHRRSIVYRDMKAENVVLDPRGRPKLIDFGMAKRFCRTDSKHEDDPDGSTHDTDDFIQPPTRYYFAAYLAPEIYDLSEAVNEYIDSWGLGYILVEMLLGYGIFHPMPWEKEPNHHLNENWKLTLPKDVKEHVSARSIDFMHKMLLRNPKDRLNLEKAAKHELLARVPWNMLPSLRGPDLSKCPSKANNTGTGATTTTTTTTASLNARQGGQKRWANKAYYNVCVPDMSFVREFTGGSAGVASSNPAYAIHMASNAIRRIRLSRVLPVKVGSNQGPTDGHSGHVEQDGHRVRDIIAQKKSFHVDNAIEVRTVQPIRLSDSNQKHNHAPVHRMVHRPGFYAS